MKNLIDYLKEERKSVFVDIQDAAYSWIDYMYNEGVIDYDDKHLVSYNNGKSVPNFIDIIKGILDESTKLDNTTIIVLKKYLKEGAPKNKQSAVENAILSAIEKFVEDGNCEKFA